MARLKQRDDTYFSTVRGMCRSCRKIVPARIFFQDEKVWQQSLCPTCENAPALIAADKNWYLENGIRLVPDGSPLKGSYPMKKGCPHDCGPCTWHAASCQLPVISVTNSCNLRCPICFTYNRPDRIYHMPVEEMKRTVDWIIESSDRVDLINITGGEPTLHPQILDLLGLCKRPEIGRITMNSNGLRLAEDRRLCAELAELGIYVILSFNTFDRETSVAIHGQDVVEAKLRAIENLTRAGAKMTLLHVMLRKVNENAIAGLLDLMRTNDRILSLTVQTMTYTGQGGGRWPLREHIPVDEAARMICEQSGGTLEFSDFLPRPSTHPLCYLTCYMLKSGETFLPFARFAPSEKVLSLMKNSYLIRLDDEEDFFKDVINQLHARNKAEPLKLLRELIETLYPPDRYVGLFERQQLAESSVRTIYVHAHMDEDTFDCSRAMLCPDQVPAEPGRLIPACTYNLFYRMQDERFYVKP
jgi:hypothetical protein